MSYLIRRINRPKWPDFESKVGEDQKSNWFNLRFWISGPEVQADAITGCLKTTKNTLSVWNVEEISEKELKNIALALITGSMQLKISAMHVVAIEEEKFIKKGIEVVASDGDTIVNDLVKRHKDLSNLTYRKLGIVKEVVVDSIKRNKVRLFTKQELKTILLEGIANGLVDKAKLNPKLIETEKI